MEASTATAPSPPGLLDQPVSSTTKRPHACPRRLAEGVSQIAFPIMVLLKDDHKDFDQEERLGLPYWTMIFFAVCVVVDESKRLDIPIWEFSVILGASSILTWVYISRH